MSNGRKYSIPKNYFVENVNGMNGLVRQGKKGDKWILEPIYRNLIISKTFGRLLIAYRSSYDVANGDTFLKIMDFSRNFVLKQPVYDVLFGQNVLYIRTIRPSTGNVEWCKVNDNLNGGLFVGDFDVIGRLSSMPFHIPIGTDTIVVKANGIYKNLIIDTGIVDGSISRVEGKVSVPVVEEVITHYNVVMNDDGTSLKFYKTDKKSFIKQTMSMGELSEYRVIIENILGGMENVPRDRAEKLYRFMSNFMAYSNSMVLPIIYGYSKNKINGSVDNILDCMLKELEYGWSDIDGVYKVKLYTYTNVVLILMKLNDDKINVGYYIIQDDAAFDVNDVKSIFDCYNETGVKFSTIKIDSYELDEHIDNSEGIKGLQSPYPVRIRYSVASDVKEYTYNNIDIYYLKSHIEGVDNKKYGDIGVRIIICDRFKYKSKQKSGNNVGDWIVTNTSYVGIA